MEQEESIDKCIFNGHLRDEPTVYVTLTEGCPFDKDFNVRMVLIVAIATFSSSQSLHYRAQNAIFKAVIFLSPCAIRQQQKAALMLI